MSKILYIDRSLFNCQGHHSFARHCVKNLEYLLVISMFQIARVLIKCLYTGGESTRKCAEKALDVLKVGFSITKSHEEIAIADERKNHTYGEILHSSFQLSLLLRSLFREERLLSVSNASNKADGAGGNDAQQEASKTLAVCFLFAELINFLGLT